MKFVLSNIAGHVEAEGILPEFAVGVPSVLVWRGRSFVRDGMRGGRAHFAEHFGAAIGYFDATPIRTEPSVWTTPTELGKIAAAEPAPAERPRRRPRGS